jgi:hypothetical protein
MNVNQYNLNLSLITLDYLRDDDHKTSGYSYLRVAMIRIDVHHVGENLIHMPYMLPAPVHVRNSYASYGQSPYMATFHTDPTELDKFTATQKSAPDSTSQPG